MQIGTVAHSTANKATVYNLTVSDVHTYYVLAGNEPVLVHNCGGSEDGHGSGCDCANGGQPRGADGRFLEDPDSGGGSGWTDSDRRAAWRAIYDDPDSALYPSERAQIPQRGWRGPQRINPWTGEMETMELSHEPIPRRLGGTKVAPQWPDAHAWIDPDRFLKGNRIPFTNIYPD